MKKFLLALVALGCCGCFSPFSTWSDGTPMYPGAYQTEWQRIHAPGYQPTFYERYFEGTGCSEPLNDNSCPGRVSRGLLSIGMP
jgi:hypothetical protein